MRPRRLKSSIIATAVGSTLVVGAFAANSMTQPQGSDVAVKGDRLMVATKVAYPDARISQAFDTFVEHDREAGVTTLTRVPHTAD